MRLLGPEARAGGWARRGGTILLGRGGDALLRFGIFLATARVLVPEEFSRYALLTAALATCQVVLGFGAPRTAMFLHARGSRRLLLGWLVLLAAAAALAATLGLTLLPSLRRLVFPEVPTRLVFPYLYSRGLGRRVLAVHATGLAANLVLCLAAIPRFGARGAWP